MAKIIPSLSRATLLKARRLKSMIFVGRVSGGSRGAHGKMFQACVIVGQTSAKTMRCAFGRNPRIAIAKALRKEATKIQNRSGAFAGLSSSSSRKRRRKRRR